jgi:hypothetical protein
MLSLGVLAAGCSSSTRSNSTSAVVVAPATTAPVTSSVLNTTTVGSVATAPTTANLNPDTSVSTESAPSVVSTAAPAVGAVDPNAPEIVEPGDIPDNQVFVVAMAPEGTYSIKVPEGWARTEQDGTVTFSDKYNSVSVRSKPSTVAPTVASVTDTDLNDIASDPTFKLVSVTTVTRKAGDGVVATYEIGSVANVVTAKKALLAVERYFFTHNGITVELTLSGAKGADNVDPWKIVSDSLSWK